MTIRRNYVPPQRRRTLNYKIVIPFLVLVLILAYISYNAFFPKNDENDTGMSICGLSAYKTRELLKNVNTDLTIETNDYFYYGETLNLLHNSYSLTNRDDFAGQTIYLNNLCNSSEKSYFLGASVDSQIPVESLEEGFYTVSISQNLDKRLLISPAQISDTFYTVRRNGKLNRIRLISDRTLFDSGIESNLLTQNYLFIEVTALDETDPSVTESAGIYDVVIDPYGMNEDSGALYAGVSANGLSEYQETYGIALTMKNTLESAGLKVLIARSSEDEVINTYGNPSRILRAKESGAKYYLDLQLNASEDTAAQGGQIVYSSHASNKFATAIFKHLKTTTQLPSISYGSSTNYNGVLVSPMTNGFDDRSIIRETGGYALGAGIITSNSKDYSQLASYMKDNRHGMQCVSLEYFMVTNPEISAMWKQNRDAIGIESANALLISLGLTGN